MTRPVVINFELNGRQQVIHVEPGDTLLDLLRCRLGLTGTKEGCRTGDCGACTVLVDGDPVNSCIYPAAKVDGRQVTTIEGLARSGELDAIQQAFLDAGAVQCGYCTPGMIMSAKALLTRNSSPSRAEIREALSGNLCRCTGYEQVIEAIEKARDRLAEGVPCQAPQHGPAHLTRFDGVAKVTGRTKYATDMWLPGMLRVCAVRSPYAHAVVEEIDTGEAARQPGVACVLTAVDIPGKNAHGNYNVMDQPVLVPVGGKVRMRGETIAVVAAETETAARNAARKVKVRYRRLEPVTDPEVALADGTPRVHDKLLCAEYEYSRGDAERAFTEADFVVEETYHIEPQEHAYLETESGLAQVGEDGMLTVWGPTQDIWYMRQALALILGMSESRIRAVSPQIGGSFGGKQPLSVHPYVALVALRTGRPAKMVWTRDESLQVSTKRHGARVHHRLAGNRDSRLTAMQVDVVLDAGAYTSETPGVIRYMAMHLCSAYEIPNVKIRSRAPFTNNPVAGAYRGFGGPQAVLPTELQVQALARKMGLDALELRLRNAIRPGSEQTMPGIAMCGNNELHSSVEPILRNLPPRLEAPAGILCGRGMTTTMSLYCVGAQRLRGMRGTGVDLEILRDGSLVLHTSQVEMGVGTVSALLQMVHEAFGVGEERLSARFGDSDSTPKSGPQVASRTLFTSGKALEGAIRELSGRILEFVAERHEEPPDGLEFRDGRVVSATSGREYLLGEVAEAYYQDGRDPKVCYWYDTDHTNAGHTFSSALADVEIDPGTGRIAVRRLWFSHDAGRAIHPQNIRGQHFGGALQSIGYVLHESLGVSGGTVRASDLRTYMIPTIADTPPDFRCFIVENPDERGPSGARGLAEHASDLVPSAVAAAVSEALGVTVNRFPILPEDVLRILAAKEEMVR